MIDLGLEKRCVLADLYSLFDQRKNSYVSVARPCLEGCLQILAFAIESERGDVHSGSKSQCISSVTLMSCQDVMARFYLGSSLTVIISARLEILQPAVDRTRSSSYLI